MFDLERSPVLSDGQWTAIQQHLQRIGRARQQRDPAQGVGSAKEMVETIARVALEAKGITAGSGASLSDLVHKAHEVLEFPRGDDIAHDTGTKSIIRQAKVAAIKLGDLRNSVGTGHGSATPRDAIAEHADIALDAAVMWCRWALRRLGKVVIGQHAELIGDLNGGNTFSGGDLRTRLLAINLPDIDPADQRAIGVAVGRRAARDTVTVRIDGVEAAAPGPQWPIDYRLGVVEGLVMTDDGYVRTNRTAAGHIPILLADADQHDVAVAAMIDNLVPEVLLAEVSIANDLAQRQAIAHDLRRAAANPATPAQVRVLLECLADKFSPLF